MSRAPTEDENYQPYDADDGGTYDPSYWGFSREALKALRWRLADSDDGTLCIGTHTCWGGCWDDGLCIVESYGCAELSSPDEVESAVAGLLAVQEGVG